MFWASSAGRGLAVLAFLVGACGGGTGTGLEVEVVDETQGSRATHLLLDWMDDERFLKRDLRVPAEGVLDPSVSPLARVRFEAPAGAAGLRRVVVRGMIENNVVSEGTGSGQVSAGTWETIMVALLAGRRSDRDGDRVPDDIDGCPEDGARHASPCGAGAPDAGMIDPRDAGPVDDAAVDTTPVPPDADSIDGPPAVVPDAGTDTSPDGSTLGAPQTFPCGNVLLVVGAVDNPGDLAMAGRLRLAGCTVTTIDDTVVTAADAAGKSLAVISETTSGGQVTSKLKGVAIGVLLMEAQLLDDYAFNRNAQLTDWDNTAMASTVTIADPAHPLAGGLSGTLPIFSSSALLGWGKPDAVAATRAVSVGDPMRFLVYGFEKGATMSAVFVAPGRRVALPLPAESVLKLNREGWILFDAVARWTSGN